MRPDADFPMISENEAIEFEDPRKELHMVLSRLFDLMVPIGLILGGIALSVSIYQSLNNGWYFTLSLHLAMYMVAFVALVFRRHLPVVLLLALLIGLISIDIIESLLKFGLAGPSITHLAILCLLVSIFVGLKMGIVTMVIGVGATAITGAGVYFGKVRMLPDIVGNLSDPVNWIVQLSCMILYLLPLLIVVDGMKKRLYTSIKGLQETNARMKQEISEKCRIEDELRESEEKYRTIFEKAIEGIFQATPNGRLLSVNPSLAKMAGFDSSDEMIDKVANFEERLLIHPADRSKFKRLLSKDGYVKGFETQSRRKDGKIFWTLINSRALYDKNGDIVRWEGSVEDLTKGKHAEIALKESEAKYRNVVESSLVCFYIMQDGLFRFVNKQFCYLSEYAYEELVDKTNPLELVDIADRARISGYIKEHLTGQGHHTECEFRCTKKSGEVVTVKSHSNFMGYNGRPAVCGTLMDITHERRLESRLRQAQKMEAIGTLTGGIAHDFNNLLTAISGFGSILQTEIEPSDPNRSYVDQIVHASLKASELTKGLLAFGREQNITLRPVNINEIVRGTEKILKRLITEDIMLEIRLNHENIVVMADTVQIDQILLNLAVNAGDAMPHGGKLIIQVGLKDIDTEFIKRHGFGAPGEYALLSVKDTGTGMDDQTAKKIFDPFFTTKNLGQGTGLGLSTVYGIVQQHHGYITVESMPDQGTTFYIYLPTTKMDTKHEKQQTASPRRGNETVLVAEDEETLRTLMADILSQHGYTPILATDGEEAVNEYKCNRPVDLIILDTIMPKKNGKEVYDELRLLDQDFKTIFTSGYAADILLDKGIEEHELDFLKKPFSIPELLMKIRKVLDR